MFCALPILSLFGPIKPTILYATGVTFQLLVSPSADGSEGKSEEKKKEGSPVRSSSTSKDCGSSEKRSVDEDQATVKDRSES